MTSLTMLLLRAPLERLREVAQFWGLEDGVHSQPELADSLMRDLASPWKASDVLDRLRDEERTVLYRLLDQPKGHIVFAALADSLGRAEGALEAALASLQRGALVLVEDIPLARVSGWHPQNRGVRLSEATRVVHVPPEILGLLRQARRLLSTGDISESALPSLLEQLDVPSLQRLARRWHVLAPHEYFRKDLLAMLESRARDRTSLDAAVGTLDAETRALFDWIRTQGGKAAVGALQERFSEPVLRRGFAELSDLFLLHQTYIDSRRFLFIPVDVFTASLGPAPTVSTAVLDRCDPPRRQQNAGFALAWDLLTVAGYLAQNPTELTQAEHRLPKRTAARINALLHVKAISPAEDYRLRYLLHVGANLGLLKEEGSRLSGTGGVAGWAAQGFTAQTKQLFDLWMSDRTWYEAAGFEAIYWGSDRIAAR